MAVRLSQQVVEAVVKPTDLNARLSQLTVEAVVYPTDVKARVTQVVIEVLQVNTSASTYDESATLTSDADMSQAYNGDWVASADISGSSALIFTLPELDETQTISGSSAVSFAAQIDFGPTISFTSSGASSLDIGVNQVEARIENVAATLDASSTAIQFVSISLSDISTILFSGVLNIDLTASFSGSGTIDFVAGFTLAESLTETGSAAIDFGDGFGYERSLDLDASAAMDQSFQHGVGGTVSLDSTSSMTLALQATFEASIALPSVADFDVEGVVEKILSTSNTLTFTQSATVVRSRAVSASNTLSFTQSVFRNWTAQNALVLSQNVLVGIAKIRSVGHVLTLTQQATKTQVMTRSASNFLAFLNYFTKSVALNEEVRVLPAEVGIVKAHCDFVVSVPQMSVVLPCPIWGDTEASTSQVSIKRAINGRMYTYVKSSDTYKLKYTFNMGRKKSLELRDFVMNYNSRIMTLLNHNGETWKVNLLTNPVDLAPKMIWKNELERVDVTLEFEGIKING